MLVNSCNTYLLCMLFQVTYSMRVNDKPLEAWVIVSSDGTVGLTETYLGLCQPNNCYYH